MRLFIFCLIYSTVSLFTQVVNAQENCKYNVDKKDPFTDKPVHAIITPIKVSIFPTYNWQLFLYKDGDSYHIETSVAFVGNVSDVMEKGDSIQFKFESGKILSLHARDRINPLISGSDLKTTAYQNVYFEISNDDFGLFSTSPVAYVQMNTGSRKYQEKVNEKNAKKIINAALCVMK